MLGGILLHFKSLILVFLGLEQPKPVIPAAAAVVDLPPVNADSESRLVEPRTEAEFHRAVERNPVTFVDFSATWCGPCKRISPVFDELSAKFESAGFVKVDVDVLEGVAGKFKVSAMPTFIVLRDGKEVDRMMGANAAGLTAMVAKHAN